MSGKRERKSMFWADVSTFLRERDVFIQRQVLMDASLRASAYRTANCIAIHVNFETACAEVSYDAHVDAFGVSEDTVARDLKDLEQKGHYHVEWGAGRNGTHKVRWIIKPQTRSGAFHGMDHENTVKSTKKAGGNRKGSANLRTPESDDLSANLRQTHRKTADSRPQICGPNTNGNTQDNTQSGGRALGRASASTSDVVDSHDDVSLIEDIETDDQVMKCGSEALKEPLAASPDPSDPDAWRSDPAYASDYADVASEGDDDVDPKACGGHNDTRASATLDDLERWAREETSAQPDDEGDDCPELNEDAAGRAPKCAASDAAEDDQFGDENRFAVAAYNAARSVGVDDLAAIYDAPDVDLEKHIDDAADGLSGGDPAAAFRFSRDLRLLLQQIAPTRREAVRAAHLKVITTFIAAVGGGRPYAERVIADFLRSEGQNKMEVHNG